MLKRPKVTPTKEQLAARIQEIHKLVLEINFPVDDWRYVYDAQCGNHSGFPPCCIKFFTDFWMPAAGRDLSDPVWKKAWQEHWDKLNELQDLDNCPYYIPCPKCLESKNFVQLQECDFHFTKAQWKKALGLSTILPRNRNGYHGC